jgi:Transposase, Mutator family
MGLARSPFAVAAELLYPQPSPYLNDPVGCATNRLGQLWWSGQREIAEMMVRNRYSAIRASHDVSKSHTVSKFAWWWIDVHPPDRSLAEQEFPYLFVDATNGKARVGGDRRGRGRRVTAQAIVVATGVSADGRREVLGCESATANQARSGPNSCAR